ncbi:MAG TPA: GTP-binding protein, partial [Casimicrobiaceae bacterium]|nr:GTP-binding protein [Casimicrobiaceae bacterium]
WQDFLARYVATRQTLAGLVLVVDIRHGLAEQDRALLRAYLPSSRPVLVLATKSDKLTPSAARVAARDLERDLVAMFPEHGERITVIVFSATRRVGIEDAEALVAQWLGIDIETPKEKAPPSRGVTRGPKRPS